jgi:hypothetical protein
MDSNTSFKSRHMARDMALSLSGLFSTTVVMGPLRFTKIPVCISNP